MFKPFTSIDQQMRLLEERGMTTDARTKWLLEREGYYSIINGYKDLFLDKQATDAAHDDRYRKGTTFKDIHELFVFDRRLRFEFFHIFTLSEAVLKTICSHEFTRANQNVKNPYLKASVYYDNNSSKVKKLITIFQKILELDEGSRHRGDYGGKSYIKHCMEAHDGEVPMWVLTNDLTLGQIYWFYQCQAPDVRKSIAIAFTNLYGDSHRHKRDVTSQMLDKIYRRIKDYRNICAHDERLYCAHPHDANITVIQVIKDLQFVVDKQRYMEFLQKIQTLIETVCIKIPDCASGIYMSMGMKDQQQLTEMLDEVRKS